MNPREINSWIKRIKDHENRVAKERDRIRESISELEALEEVCDRAVEDLCAAADALSELV